MTNSSTKIFLTLIVLVFPSCKYNQALNGNWGIVEIFYGQNEISGNDLNKRKVYFAPTLKIKGSRIFINLSSKNTNLSGRIHYTRKNGEEFLKMTGLEDSRLNTKYKMNLYLTEGTNTSKYREYEMILESDSVYIRAVKSFASG